MDKIKDFMIKALPYVLPAIVTLIAGIALGWSMKPDTVKVEEKVKVVEVEKQVVVEHEKVQIVRVKDTQYVERYHREKTEEKKPDGTVLTKEVEDKNIDSIVHENQTEVKIVEVEKQVIVERDKVVERIVTPTLTQWHVGVLIGVAPRFDAPTTTPIMVGVEAERRIVGPFYGGIWAMGGSPVVGGFSLTNVSAGLKVSMEF